MSSAPAWVRLSDGTVRGAWYSGTSDVLWPGLAVEPAIASIPGPEPACDCGPAPASAWTSYGGGFGWDVEACEHRVHVGRHPFGLEGLGRWIEEPRTVFEERPDWVQGPATPSERAVERERIRFERNLSRGPNMEPPSP